MTDDRHRTSAKLTYTRDLRRPAGARVPVHDRARAPHALLGPGRREHADREHHGRAASGRPVRDDHGERRDRRASTRCAAVFVEVDRARAARLDRARRRGRHDHVDHVHRSRRRPHRGASSTRPNVPEMYTHARGPGRHSRARSTSSRPTSPRSDGWSKASSGSMSRTARPLRRRGERSHDRGGHRCRSSESTPCPCPSTVSSPVPSRVSTTRSGSAVSELHEWIFETRGWRQMMGDDGGDRPGSTTTPRGRLRRHRRHVMGRNMFGPVRGRVERDRGRAGTDGGARTRRTTTPSSCSRTTPAHRSRWRAARPSTSSPTASRRRSTGLRRRRRRTTSASAGARPRSSEYLRAGLVDELNVAIVPVLLGGGERLFDGDGAIAEGYECAEFVQGASAVHARLVRVEPQAS